MNRRSAKPTRWIRLLIRPGITFATPTRTMQKCRFDPEIANYWMPVEQYIGGVDHAVMHLLYTRFWTKVMRDIGLVNFDEPVKNLLTQGMVVGESYYSEDKCELCSRRTKLISSATNAEKSSSADLKSDDSPIKVAVEKMSKSKYNGVDPDDMVLIYGADAVRNFRSVCRARRKRTGLAGNRNRRRGQIFAESLPLCLSVARSFEQ